MMFRKPARVPENTANGHQNGCWRSQRRAMEAVCGWLRRYRNRAVELGSRFVEEVVIHVLTRGLQVVTLDIMRPSAEQFAHHVGAFY